MPNKILRKTFTFDGRRYDVTARTPEELAIKIHERKKELESGTLVVNSNTTVEKWADEWLKTYKAPTVGVAWYREIERMISNRIVVNIGNLPLKNIRQLHIQKILISVEGMSKSYIDKIYNILNELFQSAAENRLIDVNPVEGTKKPAAKKKQKKRALTEYERTHITSLSETHRAGLFVLLVLRCGLRPGEVAALQWRNIDLPKNTIKIEQALKRDGTIGSPKSAAGERSVPIPNDLLDKLKKARSAPFSLVCTQASGNPHTKTSIRQMWESFIYQLNIAMGCQTFRGGLIAPYRVADDLVMYTLRHTYCTDLQAAGVPINVARELMGHADISTTSKIYTHGSAESISTAIDAINALSEKRNVGIDVGVGSESIGK